MMCFTLLCQLGSCGTRFPRISFRERFQEKRCKGRTCVGCGRRRWSSGYHFQKRIVSRWVQTDRHRGALWAPLLLIPLDPCPPAPLQAHHRHWAAESQMCWEYRGHSRITHTVPTAHGRQAGSAMTEEKCDIPKVLKTQRNCLLTCSRFFLHIALLLKYSLYII